MKTSGVIAIIGFAIGVIVFLGFIGRAENVMQEIAACLFSLTASVSLYILARGIHML